VIAIVLPTQTLVVPVIEAIVLLTVTCLAVKQVEEVAYVMIVVPLATPVNTPDVLLIVALVVFELVHVPPVVVLVRVVVVAGQRLALPAIAGRAAFTVTVVVLVHPALR
jgi:hypothetical protein